MRKYWAFCCANIQNTIAYRGPIIIWLLNNVFALIAIVAVWFSASAGKTIATYTKQELITYYVAALFLQWLTGWFPFYGIVDEIKHGRIVLTALVKPISYFWQKFAEELGWHIISAFVGLIATFLFILLLRGHLVFYPLRINFFFLVVTIFLAILVVFSFSLCMGLLAFWFTETGAVDSLFWAARTVLGGQGIPISFIPGIFQTLVRVLPFRYMFSFPLEIYFGKLSGIEIFQGVAIQLIWIALLLQLYRLMWNRGRRAYAAFGQ